MDGMILVSPVYSNRSIRMLKKPPNFVLGSSKSSTYPKRVRLRLRLACGLVGWPF
jgi:hypothetical protein